jgi:hypothetical protein
VPVRIGKEENIMGNKRLWLWVACTIVGFLLVVGPLAAQSSTIVLRRYTFGSGGGEASSPTLALNGTMGQPSPAGQVQSGGIVLRAGFWHGQPDEPTAVRLVVQSAEPAGASGLAVALLALALSGCLFLTGRAFARQQRTLHGRLWRKQ